MWTNIKFICKNLLKILLPVYVMFCIINISRLENFSLFGWLQQGTELFNKPMYGNTIDLIKSTYNGVSASFVDGISFKDTIIGYLSYFTIPMRVAWMWFSNGLQFVFDFFKWITFN